LRAEIEGLSAGIVDGWGKEEPGSEKVTGGLHFARKGEN